MAQKLWFASDAHFGHANVLELDRRPFSTIEEHDQALVTYWNETVGPRDTVWFLGDWAYRCSLDYLQALIGRLHGRIHVIWGNHDRRYARRLYARDKQLFVEAHDLHEIKYCGQRITLCHYAMRVWPGSHKGTWHLHGHSHGNLSPRGASLDVGLPCNRLRPVSFEEVKAQLEGRPPTFHHGSGADFFKNYPQHRLLQSQRVKLDNVWDFLRWLERAYPETLPTDALRQAVYQWVGVDETAYEAEKRRMVDYVRNG